MGYWHFIGEAKEQELESFYTSHKSQTFMYIAYSRPSLWQVFEYHSVVRNVGFTNYFPVQEMVCSAKLRSVFALTSGTPRWLVIASYPGPTPSFWSHAVQ